MEVTAGRFTQIIEQLTEHTITSIVPDCLPSEYDHEVKTSQGTIICIRAQFKSHIGAVYAVTIHDSGSRENAPAAGTRNHPSRRGMCRSGTGGANGTAHMPQENKNQDGSNKKDCMCHACKKRSHSKRNCPTHKTVAGAAVAENAARRSGGAEPEETESGW